MRLKEDAAGRFNENTQHQPGRTSRGASIDKPKSIGKNEVSEMEIREARSGVYGSEY